MEKNVGMCKKIKYKIEENQKTVKKGLQRQMIMYGGGGKKLKNYCVVENIEHHKKLRECDEIKDNEKSAHLCLRLRQSKAVTNGGIAPMCLIPLRRKHLKEI